MNTATISLGSNSIDKQSILSKAFGTLGVTITGSTKPYMDPVDNDSSMPYLNIVANITTELEHGELRERFKAIESQFGRTAKSKESGIVPLDIDIVIFNGEIVRPADFERPYFKLGYNQLEK